MDVIILTYRHPFWHNVTYQINLWHRGLFSIMTTPFGSSVEQRNNAAQRLLIDCFKFSPFFIVLFVLPAKVFLWLFHDGHDGWIKGRVQPLKYHRNMIQQGFYYFIMLNLIQDFKPFMIRILVVNYCNLFSVLNGKHLSSALSREASLEIYLVIQTVARTCDSG